MLARLIAFENLLLTVAEAIAGLTVGKLLARGFMAAYQNDHMRLALELQTRDRPDHRHSVLGTAAVAQLLAVRAIRRTDVAGIVREHST